MSNFKAKKGSNTGKSDLKIYLLPDVKERLTEVADMRGMSMTGLVSWIVTDWVNANYGGLFKRAK